MQDILRKVIHPIHPEGYIFIAIFAIVTIILSMFSSVLGCIGTVLTLWCMYFFRDPAKVVPNDEKFIVSPADGTVDKITRAMPPVELGMPEIEMTRVSIFLSVFDIHVNRVPTSGKITALHYRPGKFLSATLDKASEDNERQSVRMTTDFGSNDIAFVQIAGLIARRIVCNLNKDQEVKIGDRYGIIRFGSRVDVYLPTSMEILVLEGQKVIGAETIIADLSNRSGSGRIGEVK